VARFYDLLGRSILWYGGVALLLLLLILPAGLVFFTSQETDASEVAWRAPWITLVVSAALYVPIIPVLAAIEGSGQVASVSRLRFFQGVCANFLAWTVLALGVGLFAASAAFLVNTLWGYGWVIRKYPTMLIELKRNWRQKSLSSTFDWMSEVWPMQWRIAVSWISGYVIFQLFTPILFYYHGAALAGKMGISLAVANMLSNFAQVWLQANTPEMAKAVARKNWQELDSLFNRIFWQATLVNLGGSLFTLFGLWILSEMMISQRFLSLLDMAYLLAAFALSHMIGALAHYLRVHKQEPFMVLSVIGAVLVGISIWYFGRIYGVTGMVMSLLFINLIYGLPTAIWLWLRLRKIWHQPVIQIDV
jgi:hypothetical protein